MMSLCADGQRNGTVLVMGNAFGSKACVETAQRMGFKVIASDGAPACHSYAKRLADEYWDVECGDLDELERRCKENGIIGVVPGASNFVIERAIELSERLGFNACYGGLGREYETDKARFKALCEKTGVPVAKNYAITEENLDDLASLQIEYPVVVKPTDRAGNVGVAYCYNDEDLKAGFLAAKGESYAGEVVVEKMMTGDEWYSYYAIADGKTKFIALCAMLSEPGYPKNVYSITTTLTSATPKYQEVADEAVAKMLSAAGCDDCFAWVQVMTDDDGLFHAIEMGYRIDGEVMGESIRKVSNFDSYAWATEYAIGENHKEEDLIDLYPTEGSGYATSYMLWVDRDCTIGEVRGLDTLDADERLYVDCVKAPGESARQYSAIGVIDFGTKDREEAIEIIQKVNDTVQILDDEGNDVFIRFTDFAQLKC